MTSIGRFLLLNFGNSVCQEVPVILIFMCMFSISFGHWICVL